MPDKIKVGGVILNDQLASLSVLAVQDRPGIAAAVLDALGQRGVNVQFIVQTIDHRNRNQIVMCVDRADLASALAAVESLRADLQPAAVEARENVASIAVFGPDFRERPGIASQMFRALAGQDINILAISTSISTINCIIEADRLKAAREALCACFDVP